MSIYVKQALQGRYSEALYRPIYNLFQEIFIPEGSLEQRLGTWQLEMAIF